MSMRTSAGLLLAAALLAPPLLARDSTLPGEGGTAVDAQETEAPLEARVEHAIQLAQQGSGLEAALAFDAVLADPRMVSAPVDLRSRALSIAAWNDASLRQFPRATERAQQAITLAPDTVLPLFTLSSIESAQGHARPAAVLMVRAIGNVEGPMPIRPDRVGQMQRGLVDAPTERRAFLQALFENHWLSDGDEPVELWLILAGLQHEAGDGDAVRATLARIDGPMELIQLRSDKRFDAYVDRSDPRFDPKVAAQRQMDDLRVRASLSQGNDSSLTRLTTTALTLGDAAQVMAITDGVAEATADSGPLDGPEGKWAGWLLASRAAAQLRMRQTDAALQTARTAARLTEGTPYSAVHQLNLGLILTSLGRYDEARTSVASMADLAGYGAAQQQYIRFVAAYHRGDTAAMSDARHKVIGLGEDAREMQYELPLVAGQMDDAAQLLIAQLRSHELRGSTLVALQDMRTVPSLPATAAVDARWRQLKARPDVQAAVAEFGRIERYDLFGHDNAR